MIVAYVAHVKTKHGAVCGGEGTPLGTQDSTTGCVVEIVTVADVKCFPLV